jgi:RHS repeat-associated protein
MGKPAAKKLDKILSVTPGDVHIIIPPTGTPVPVPHPCTSIIKDKLANSVKVTGQPGAVKGSVSKHTPPHFPQGGSFSKPPSNRGEIFLTTSLKVYFEDREAAVLGDTAKMCADPVDQPVGKVVGTAATVLVAATSSGSGGAGDADGTAANAVGAQVTGHGAPPLNPNNMTGHPVDVATGNLIVQGDDLLLDGPIPIQFVRTYVSDRAAERGPLGHGWVHNLEERLELVQDAHPRWTSIHQQFVAAGIPAPDRQYLIHRDMNGLTTTYVAPAEGQEIVDELRKRRIRREGASWSFGDRDGITRRFAALPAAPGVFVPVETLDRNGNSNAFRYDRHGRLIEIVDSYRRVVVLRYEQDRLVALAVRTPGEPAEQLRRSYRYDGAGDLVEVVDQAGLTVRYAYAEHLLVQDTNRDGYRFYFAYDASRRCVATWGEDGYLTRSLRYDPIHKRTLVLNGEGEATIYRYTDAGVVYRIERAEGLVSELRYDDRGRLCARLNGAGILTTLEYNEAGGIAAISDGQGNSTTFEYNSFGQVTKQTNALGHTFSYEYDPRGNLTARIDPSGAAVRYEHDERGRFIAEHYPSGLTVRFSYDRFGHPEQVVHGESTSSYRYDPVGRLLRTTQPDRDSISYEWHPSGLLASVSIGDEVFESYEYNGEGQVTAHRDPRGVLRRSTFRGCGVFAEAEEFVTRPGGGETLRNRISYETDSEGRLLRARDHFGRTVTRAYDAAGRLVREVRPDGAAFTFAYDRAGRLEEIRDSHGGSERFEYEGRGYVASIRYADGTTDRLEYDELGRLASATNASAAIEYEYDELGRQVVRRQGDFELRAEIDADAGNISWLWPEDVSARYEYRTNGEGLSHALTFHGRRIEFDRDQFDRPSARRYPNGLRESYRYDRRARVSGFALQTGNRTLLDRCLTYAEDRVATLEDRAQGVTAISYDALGRLCRLDGPPAEFYRFDERDNLVASHHVADTHILHGDQLRTAGQRSYTYDPRGRVVTIHDGDRVHRLDYDAKGQVARVRLPDGGEVSYAYDPFGRRVRKTFAGGERDGTRIDFYWDGNTLAKEEVWKHETRELERYYLFNGFVPLARIDRAGASECAIFFHTDHVGRPLLCTDDGGAVVWRSTGDSYGREERVHQDVEQNIRLPGQYFDEETGLHYNRHRYYDPSVGRYLQPDPLFSLHHLSRYAYPTDPLTCGDPFGLQTMILAADPNDPATAGSLMFPSTPGPATHYMTGNVARLQAGHQGSTTANMFGGPHVNLAGVDHVFIVAHGTPTTIEYRDPSAPLQLPPPPNPPELTGRELAHYLHLRGFRGTKVTLVSCYTGGPGSTFAQTTADELGRLGVNAEIHAPDKGVGVDTHGNLHVYGLTTPGQLGPHDPGGKLNPADPGQMLKFLPRPPTPPTPP